MTLEARLAALATEIGTDVKTLTDALAGVHPAVWVGTGAPPSTDYLWVDTDETPPPSYVPPEVREDGTLPTSPADGKEIFLAVDGTSPLWHLRYRSIMHIVDGYGWEFVGGDPIVSQVPDLDLVAAGSPAAFVDAAHVGPQITIPYSGIYNARGQVNSYNNTATAGGIAFGIYANGVTPTEGYGQAYTTNVAATMQAECDFSILAGQVVKMMYLRSATLAINYRFRRMVLTPKRLKS